MDILTPSLYPADIAQKSGCSGSAKSGAEKGSMLFFLFCFNFFVFFFFFFSSFQDESTLVRFYRKRMPKPQLPVQQLVILCMLLFFFFFGLCLLRPSHSSIPYNLKRSSLIDVNSDMSAVRAKYVSCVHPRSGNLSPTILLYSI